MNILLVDDDDAGRHSISSFLTELGHQVTEARDGREAMSLYKEGQVHMVLSDLRMPVMGGLDLLRQLKARPDFLADVVFFTAYGGLESVIEALRLGAYDYLQKPLNVEELALLVERVAEHQLLIRENRHLNQHFQEAVEAAAGDAMEELRQVKEALVKAAGISLVSYRSESMHRVVQKALQLHGNRDIPVLVQGETGTGKELISRLIHFGQESSARPFVDINCAALAPSVFESELFGYEAGSFTGGVPGGQKGKFDLANGGTLFLDEISELAPALQAKLLRVIQEKEFYRVGGLKKIRIDVRIICATNRNIIKMVEEGAFRADLFYRLNVATISIPPLRNRPEDILPLAHVFLEEFAGRRGKPVRALSQSERSELLAYEWPGNVRELRNIMEWLAFSSELEETAAPGLLIARNKGIPGLPGSEARLSDQASSNEGAGEAGSFKLPSRAFDLDAHLSWIVTEALAMHGGNKTSTARYLGISRRVLEGRIKQIEERRNQPQG